MRMWGCGDMGMRVCGDVRMWGYGYEGMWGCEDVGIWRCDIILRHIGHGTRQQ